MHSWLEKYDYRASISWWVFGITAFGALFLTLATISFQAIKAAIANPVKSLRSE
jgi:ABC-type antimicrobial peptide transport system permease subunit